jgi:plasmid stabilization system protein ParE
LAGDGPALFPLRGRVGAAPGTREPVAVRPCVLVHEVTDDGMVTLAVWHGAQDRYR